MMSPVAQQIETRPPESARCARSSRRQRRDPTSRLSRPRSRRSRRLPSSSPAARRSICCVSSTSVEMPKRCSSQGAARRLQPVDPGRQLRREVEIWRSMNGTSSSRTSDQRRAIMTRTRWLTASVRGSMSAAPAGRPADRPDRRTSPRSTNGISTGASSQSTKPMTADQDQPLPADVERIVRSCRPPCARELASARALQTHDVMHAAGDRQQCGERDQAVGSARNPASRPDARVAAARRARTRSAPAS